MRFVAVALAGLYLLPPLLPGAVALVHDGYHVLQAAAGHLHADDHDHHDAPVHEHGAPVHEHGGEPHTHAHESGGVSHSHAPLVDALLIVSSSSDEVGPTHAVVEIAPGPGLHLPALRATPALVPGEAEFHCPGFTAAPVDPTIETAIPPPKA